MEGPLYIQGSFVYFNITHNPYKTMNLKISLLYRFIDSGIPPVEFRARSNVFLHSCPKELVETVTLKFQYIQTMCTEFQMPYIFSYMQQEDISLSSSNMFSLFLSIRVGCLTPDCSFWAVQTLWSSGSHHAPMQEFLALGLGLRKAICTHHGR